MVFLNKKDRGIEINGLIWSKFNVDAHGTFTANASNCGMLYQWNNKQGWSATDPAAGIGIEDWNAPHSGADGYAWKPENDPCPQGWRVPTSEEQATLLDTVNVVNVWTDDYKGSGVAGRTFTDNATGKSIFFPATGFRFYVDGRLDSPDNSSFYWSATSGSSTGTA